MFSLFTAFYIKSADESSENSVLPLCSFGPFGRAQCLIRARSIMWLSEVSPSLSPLLRLISTLTILPIYVLHAARCTLPVYFPVRLPRRSSRRRTRLNARHLPSRIHHPSPRSGPDKRRRRRYRRTLFWIRTGQKGFVGTYHGGESVPREEGGHYEWEDFGWESVSCAEGCKADTCLTLRGMKMPDVKRGCTATALFLFPVLVLAVDLDEQAPISRGC